MEIIKTCALTKKYNDKTVVNNLNLSIEKGSIFALLGVNGAGKTTTIKMLSTLTTPTSGDAYVNNFSIIKDKEKVKGIIGVSTQETSIARNLTVYENLKFMAEIYYNNKNDVIRVIDKIVKDFSLEEVLKQKAKTLSGGWQRRLSIALALIPDPLVLFLDEPTLGLDVIARRQIWQIVEGLKGKVTIILTTHYLEEAYNLADKIGIMSSGSIKNIGSGDELIKIANTTNFEEAFVKIAIGEEHERIN